ncbi:hypothetical protein BKA69DRAFT_1124725 [Paraphysoderma sedebokerense]|nr:hypothetical protein BKA69DRAFT_1124725 [Paraphysoderma sedebokerense]
MALSHLLLLIVAALAVNAAPAEKPEKEPKYELKCFPSSEIDKQVVIANKTTQPQMNEKLYGLWLLDGIPFAEDIVTFGTAKWDNAARTASIKVFGPNSWTFWDTFAGKFLYSQIYNFRLTYNITFNEDFTFGQTTPIINPILTGPIKITIPEFLADFELNYAGDGVYTRDTKFLNQTVPSYTFRRIVDAQGNRDKEAWDKFIKRAPKQSCVAVIKGN